MAPGTTPGHDGSAASRATATWPRVGVAAIVCHEGRVLLGRRIGAAHGTGHWQFPGGHLEPLEAIEACAEREVREETGLDVRIVARGPYTNDVFDDARHYVTVFVVAELSAATYDATGAVSPEPEVREPDKCAEWRWCDWDALPTPLFLPIVHLLAQGYRPPQLAVRTA
jgi:8-oxo-dGTP diphosphatase